ncbi:MAG: sugar ABC transporter substrate-binding protein [Clostridia bacterium]|nr:sugar ABC transporter substrate-binding protein [Clostridia bacterium]
MKKIISLILALALCLSMVGAASAEGGTIMWLSNLSSGIQYEATRDYLTAICEKLGYKFTIVYGDMFNDAAGNLTAVSNGMTNDVVGLIASQDGGIAAIMEQYPELYVAGYATDMISVFAPGGANEAALKNEKFLGTICDGYQNGADMGHQYFEVVKEKGWQKVSVVNFPGYAYPNQIAAVNAFMADVEAYNATAENKISIVSDPLTLEFQPLADSYFLEEGHDDLDAIVAFCAGIQFVYPTLVTAKLNGFCDMRTQMITGGFDSNSDILADIGEDKTICWICTSPAENPAYALVLLDNAINGKQYADFAVECVDSHPYVIDTAAEIEAATTKAMYGTGKVELAQISVEEVLALCLRNNPEATYAQLKELFHSEQVTVDWLLK